MPKQILNKLRPITRYHSGLRALLESFAPPVRVGKADAPCVLIPTERLGMMVSKRKNSNEGASQKSVRMLKVPMTSTLMGG